MPTRIQKERNDLVIKLRDRDKLSWQTIANRVGLKAKSTVHEIYANEKLRRSRKGK